MTVKQKKIRQILTVILIVITPIILYMTHRKTPFMMDDLWYATLLSEDTPIANLGDIVKSQIWHYNNWGGRSMTHGILQLTILAGEWWADILNVAMTLLLAWMVCLVTGQKKVFPYFCALGMPIGLNANWKMSMFWQSGAANYLYITVFILFFLFCYLREIRDRDVMVETGASTEGKKLVGITLWILPLGLVTGWSNENMGPTAWIISLLVIWMLRKERRRIPPWMILGNVSCLLGSILVIIAPGNFVRSSQVKEQQYGIWWKCFLRGYAESKAALEYLLPTLLVLGAVLLVGKFALKLSLGRVNVLLLLGAFLSWGAMALSPHYPDRASFGTMMLLVCVIVSMMEKIRREREDMTWPLWTLSVFVWLRGMYFCGEFLAICWGWIR